MTMKNKDELSDNLFASIFHSQGLAFGASPKLKFKGFYKGPPGGISMTSPRWQLPETVLSLIRRYERAISQSLGAVKAF